MRFKVFSMLLQQLLLHILLLWPSHCAFSFVLTDRLPEIEIHDVSAQAHHQSDESEQLPLVIWHGLGDNYQADGLRSVGEIAEEVNPGTYVYYIHLDEDGSGDQRATFLGNVNEQIEQVCDAMVSHEVLSKANAVNALGFSQGGQFLRGYIERCNNPPVANLVTFGSQHNGISEFQNCGDGDWLCQTFESFLKSSTFSDWVQENLVPAQYFRDPEDLEDYLENSNYLADINNEREEKNATYAENMKKLDKFVMYVFENDTTAIPKESGWFSDVNTTSHEVTKLQDRTLYKEDWIGLKYLDEKGKLVFKSLEGKHMHIPKETLEYVFATYFGVDGSRARKDGHSLEL